MCSVVVAAVVIAAVVSGRFRRSGCFLVDLVEGRGGGCLQFQVFRAERVVLLVSGGGRCLILNSVGSCVQVGCAENLN